MDVSIIIVSRNTCALTRDAIQSVVESRDSLAKEIFVVDNGSTDETPTTFPREFPSLRLIRSENNLGFARACNLAAKQSGGEFLLLLNSDARLEPDALAKSISHMRVNPDCAVAGAQLLNADGSRQNSIANFPTLATELLNKSLLRRLWPKRFQGKEQTYTSPIDIETVVGAFMLIRKSIWDKLGGLDERYFFFFEETDFCLQAHQKKFRIVHLPDVYVLHRQGQTAKQISVGARIEYWRSRYIFFKKNYCVSTRVILAIGLWLRLLVDCLAAGILTAATFGKNQRWYSRLKICAALVGWHLRGCPPKD
ncbi:MAG TPA: glycosyltransferase family 2 protein, partial [Candidatus Baltobacteraceae bacterium]|nr:glycosyltransferase family 2 protein [Candidatus Baltobacteraceae bacterium]